MTAAWIEELKAQYASDAARQFLLHGNVRDVFPAAPTAPAGLVPPGSAATGVGREHRDLDEFLHRELLGSFPVVCRYDIGAGIQVLEGKAWLNRWSGGAGWAEAKTPRAAIEWLHGFFLFLHNLAVLEQEAPIHAACLVVDAPLVVPHEASNLYHDLSATAALLRSWSRPRPDPRFTLTSFLLAENLNDLHALVRTNPLAAAVRVPLPDRAELEEELRAALTSCPAALAEFRDQPGELAGRLLGLSRLALRQLLRHEQHAGRAITHETVTALRRQRVEKESGPLIEFLESTRTLDDYLGQPALVDSLRADLRLLREGDPRGVPMGYLLCGPVGTGKTFLVQCLAGEAGLPVVVLKNFREKWVGSSEGNLEKIFRLIEALGRCFVFIDEADQALGRRSGGESNEVDGRLYGMIAQFMSEPRNQGRIVWLLASSRPDLIEIDLKRPGRVDVKLPIFPALTPADAYALLRAMARRVEPALQLPEAPPADLPIPELLTPGAAKTLADRLYKEWRVRGGSPADCLAVLLANYCPPVPLVRLVEQMRLAVAETTDRALIPPAAEAWLGSNP